jgi:hypothetical protein
MDVADIVSIKTCCYSDMHDLLFTDAVKLRGEASQLEPLVISIILI